MASVGLGAWGIPKLWSDPKPIWAIVDSSGNVTVAQAILRSPQIKLVPVTSELLHATFYASEELAIEMLDSCRDKENYRVIPYGPGGRK